MRLELRESSRATSFGRWLQTVRCRALAPIGCLADHWLAERTETIVLWARAQCEAPATFFRVPQERTCLDRSLLRVRPIASPGAEMLARRCPRQKLPQSRPE